VGVLEALGSFWASAYREVIVFTLLIPVLVWLSLRAGRLLLLDEPSLGLAPMLVREIFRVLADLRRRGLSILLVEQNVRAALQISDYGYVLEMGSIATEGPSAELARDPRVLETYLGQRRHER
jgi:branched-chain amino acid transport system ATP-binding protein